MKRANWTARAWVGCPVDTGRELWAIVIALVIALLFCGSL